MPKFTVEFEAPNATEFLRVLADFLDIPLSPTVTTRLIEPAGDRFPDDTDTAEVEAPVPNGDGSKRGRGRPKKTTVTPVEAREQNPAANSKPETAETPKPVSQTAQQLAASVAPAPTDLPSLDVLKAAITTAVRQAQKGEGDPAILGLLPGFKTETGLPFVMNAQEEHRPALFNLIKQAGLTLG